eukprot:1743366-Amphidinium_carterae.1
MATWSTPTMLYRSGTFVKIQKTNGASRRSKPDTDWIVLLVPSTKRQARCHPVPADPLCCLSKLHQSRHHREVEL